MESKDAVVAKLNASIQALQGNNEFLRVDVVQMTEKFKLVACSNLFKFT